VGVKLIETAMPLDVVSHHSAREKSIRHGHPSTLHLWWSRKPLAAARAVLFAQLVDDPASRPDLFPTEQAQDDERDRLVGLVGRLCGWEATSDRALMEQVRSEVARSCGPDVPVVWDPFAGGGSIPLEGQRLGLPVVSSDLNPVAVLLQKAVLELPRRWRGRAAVSGGALPPSSPDRAEGLAADLRAYGEQVLARAAERLQPLYPKINWQGVERHVAAYLWVRTVPCANPACTAIVPTLSNPWLRRKKGQEAWLRASWDGERLHFEAVEGTAALARSSRGAVFSCVACGTRTTAAQVQRWAAQRGGLGRALRCVVPDAGPPRPFLVLDERDVCPPVDPATTAPKTAHAADVALEPAVSNAPTYGVTKLAELHLPRQRAALAVLAEVVRAVRPLVRADAVAAGWAEDDAEQYSRDVTVLLGLVLGRLANRMSTACIWNAHLGLVEQTFIQNNAIAYPWDFAEANPLSTASGSWSSQLDWVARVIDRCDPAADAVVVQHDARDAPPALAGREVVVSLDPPYFDYFVYSCLSDFFYVWLRAALSEAVPELFGTIMTPRQSEIVLRRGEAAAAQQGFLDGLVEALTTVRDTSSSEYPITIYYAYRSTGAAVGSLSAWEAFLAAVKAAGLAVTATWPIRTERTEGIKTGTNSLASSIVVVCRPRPRDAARTDRRAFLAELRKQVPAALRRLQTTGISPVDLAQAAIGPAMSVYTRYADVLDADGQPLSVGEALRAVNQVIGQTLTEQEGDLDATSRFCLAWFEQYGFGDGPYGAADGLAKAKNTNVAALQRSGAVRSGGSRVALLAPEDYPEDHRVDRERQVSVWEVVLHLAKRLDEQGAARAAVLLAQARDLVDLQAGRELAYLLYTISQQKSRPQAAALFNGLGTAWNDLEAMARRSTAGED
jgi:putative DNA methylase